MLTVKLLRQTVCLLALSLIGWAQAAEPLVAHVFVALADNAHQGIVPVPAALGDGDDLAKNLYWGAAYGVKTFFSKKAPGWKLEYCRDALSSAVLERCVFSTRHPPDAYLVADAYRGQNIGDAMADFMASTAGRWALDESSPKDRPAIRLRAPNGAALSIYVGHNGLMDPPL